MTTATQPTTAKPLARVLVDNAPYTLLRIEDGKAVIQEDHTEVLFRAPLSQVFPMDDASEAIARVLLRKAQLTRPVSRKADATTTWAKTVVPADAKSDGSYSGSAATTQPAKPKRVSAATQRASTLTAKAKTNAVALAAKPVEAPAVAPAASIAPAPKRVLPVRTLASMDVDELREKQAKLEVVALEAQREAKSGRTKEAREGAATRLATTEAQVKAVVSELANRLADKAPTTISVPAPKVKVSTVKASTVTKPTVLKGVSTMVATTAKAARQAASAPGATRPQQTVGQQQALARLSDGRTVKQALLAAIKGVPGVAAVPALLAKDKSDTGKTLAAYWAASTDSRRKVLVRESDKA